MVVLEQAENLRLIKRDGKFVIQEKKWLKWEDVTFGPYGRYPVGYSEFTIERIARGLYEEEVKKY